MVKLTVTVMVIVTVSIAVLVLVIWVISVSSMTTMASMVSMNEEEHSALLGAAASRQEASKNLSPCGCGSFFAGASSITPAHASIQCLRLKR